MVCERGLSVAHILGPQGGVLLHLASQFQVTKHIAGSAQDCGNSITSKLDLL